jgi:hypothetical protein
MFRIVIFTILFFILPFISFGLTERQVFLDKHGIKDDPQKVRAISLSDISDKGLKHL